LHRASRLADNTQAAASLGHAYAIAGRRVDAQRVIADLVENSTRRYVSPYDIATVWAGLGDEAQTLRWLEKAHDDRSGWLALWSKSLTRSLMPFAPAANSRAFCGERA
jgi:hypothetical protein